MQHQQQSYKELPLLVSKEILLEKFKKYEWKSIDDNFPTVTDNPLILCTSDSKFKNPIFEIYYCKTELEKEQLELRYKEDLSKKIRIRLWSYIKMLPNEFFITELDEMFFESSVQKALKDVAEILKQKK